MKTSFLESQAKLFAIAESQSGLFTAKQAHEAGYDQTNHSYHVRAGNWQREHRGIFRLTHFPTPERSDLIIWSLWSRNRKDQPQGVYSHQTALSIYDLSDLMPAKLHMTVPPTFRKNSKTPPILVLHYANLSPQETEERQGYRLTRPIQTFLDLMNQGEVSKEMLSKTFLEAKARGLITEMDLEKNRHHLSFLTNRKYPLKKK